MKTGLAHSTRIHEPPHLRLRIHRWTLPIRSTVWLCLLLCCAYVRPAQAALSLTPGNIIAINSEFVATNVHINTLYELTPSGTVVGTQLVTNPIGSYFSGLSIIGDKIYLSDVNARVGDVDLTSGAWTPDFQAFGGARGSEALGNLGENLLIAAWGGNVNEYTTSGTLVRTLSSPSLWITGIDASDTQILTVDYFSSNVFAQSNTTGALQSSFGSLVYPNTASGLAYDPSSNSLLIATGYGGGMHTISRYSTSGSFQSEFIAPAQSIYGIDVVPLAVATVPEPNALAAWSGFAVLGLAMGAVRRRVKPRSLKANSIG